jgi:plastocyanin
MSMLSRLGGSEWVLAAGLALAFASGCGDDTGDGGTTTGNQGGDGTGGAGTGGTGTGGTGNLVNGCSEATALDRTGEATVSISEIQAWQIPHQVCVIVDAGTSVEWDGDFTVHPLSGGVVGSPDPSSPITDSDQSGASTSVTLATAGEYPYFCTVHGSSMQGVIYAQ